MAGLASQLFERGGLREEVLDDGDDRDDAERAEKEREETERRVEHEKSNEAEHGHEAVFPRWLFPNHIGQVIQRGYFASQMMASLAGHRVYKMDKTGSGLNGTKNLSLNNDLLFSNRYF